jgi:thiol:disulfide interchange protein DsbD
MNTLKVVLGFIELALAIKFLSNADLVAHWGILKREVFIGLWILIFVVMIAYLFGFIPISS